MYVQTFDYSCPVFPMLMARKRTAGATTDRRRRDYEPKTSFQRWIKPLLDGRDWTYSDLFRELTLAGEEVTENYVYRIVRGDPQKFKNAQRPGYELAFAIGRILGDVRAAIVAAEYPIPDDIISSPDFQKTLKGRKVVAYGEDGRQIELQGDGLELVDFALDRSKRLAETP